MNTAQPQEEALIDAARRARVHAYAPYSHFAVGVALQDEHGRLHLGCNVENAAYPQSLCAEAGALSAMVLGGGRQVTAVAVVAGQADLPVVTPCGGCRQKLREFASEDTPILLADPSGLRRRTTLGQLLPDSFGPQHLSVTPAGRVHP